MIKIISITVLLSFFFSTTAAPALAAMTYLYDANGNMTSDGIQCREYNESNQLKKVKRCSDNKTIAEYVYDHTGKRIIKKEYENGTLKRTVYSPTDEYETVVLASSGATQNTTYYKANDEVVAKKNPDGTINYYHNDHLGSNSVLTDQSGNVVERTTYEPYGEVKSGGTKSKFGYTGQEKDSETGLNYYEARYYDSHNMHFTQADDIIQDPYDPQTLNRYSYVKNNPIRYTDPTGHCPECYVALGGGYFLLGLEIGGFTHGAINSSDRTFGGKLKSGIIGAQYAVESPEGQIALNTILIGSALMSGRTLVAGQNKNDVIKQNPPRVSSGSVVGQQQSGGFKIGPIQWKGNELSIGENIRIAPYGNPNAKPKADGSVDWAKRLPHIHYPKKDVKGDIIPGEGGRRHRPWETLFKRWFK